MVANGHEEYPHNFKKVLNALNNLFGSKVGKGESFDTEKETIEFRSQSYGGGLDATGQISWVKAAFCLSDF